MGKSDRRNRQAKRCGAGFNKALKEALCRYRDNMLAQVQTEEKEPLPVSGGFYRKNEALGSVSAAMERRRKRYKRKSALIKGAAKAAAVVLVFFITGVAELPWHIAETVTAKSGSITITWFSDHVKISFEPVPEEELASVKIREPEDFKLGYIPDGFELQEEYLAPGANDYIYKDEHGCFLVFCVYRRQVVSWENINRVKSWGKSFSSTVMDNEHTTFHMIMDGSTELIAAGSPGEEIDTLLWVQDNCYLILDLVKRQEHDYDIFDIYHSIQVKNDEK